MVLAMNKISTFIAFVLFISSTILSTSALAGGSKAPALNPAEFIGSYSGFVDGQKLVLEQTTIACPEAFQITGSQDSAGFYNLGLIASDYGRVASFPAVNGGRTRSGAFFSGSFTTGDALVLEKGHDYWSDGRGPRPPSADPTYPPEYRVVIDYSIQVRLRENTVELSTNSWRSKCVYNR